MIENNEKLLLNIAEFIERDPSSDKEKLTMFQYLAKFIANSIQGELITCCEYNNENYTQFQDMVKYSFLLELSEENYLNCSIELEISKTPVITCVWNFQRLLMNLERVSTEERAFHFEKRGAEGMEAILIEPIGLVLVTDGNHSINSGIVHNEGVIRVNKKVNIATMLEKYRFDGENYISIKSKKPIVNNYLKDQTKPFTYNMGVLFELAKILNYLKKCIKN